MYYNFYSNINRCLRQEKEGVSEQNRENFLATCCFVEIFFCETYNKAENRKGEWWMRRMGRSFWVALPIDCMGNIDYHCFFAAACCWNFVLLRSCFLQPRHQSKNKMEQVISTQVQQLMSETEGEFMQVERGSDGQVLSVGMDVVRANMLKAQLSENLSQEFAKLSQEELSIPVGSLVGGVFLTGRGPELSFHLEPYGAAQVNFMQEFSQAGINQTVYRVQLRVQAQMILYAGNDQIVPEVDTTFLLEERMIAGEVPSVYPWGVQNTKAT